MTYDYIINVSLELLNKHHIPNYILPILDKCGIAVVRHWRAIAFQIDAVHSKILEIKLVLLVALHDIEVANQTNYYHVLNGAGIKIVKVDKRLILMDVQVLYLDVRIEMPYILHLEKLHVRHYGRGGMLLNVDI